MSEQAAPIDQALITQITETVNGVLKRGTDKIRDEQNAYRAQVAEDRAAMRADFEAALGLAAKAPVGAVDVDKLKAELRAEAQAEMRTMVGAVASNLPPGVAAKIMESVPAKDGSKPSVVSRFNRAVFGTPPMAVPFTKAQALEELKTEQPSDAVLAAGERGLHALGVRYAFEQGIVAAPRKGLETWQIVALSVGGVAAVGVIGVAAKIAYDANKKEKSQTADVVDGVIVF